MVGSIPCAQITISKGRSRLRYGAGGVCTEAMVIIDTNWHALPTLYIHDWGLGLQCHGHRTCMVWITYR